MENVSNNTKMAFTEVYDIIKHSDKDIQNKISDKFISIINKYRDLNYIPKIDYSKDFEDLNIMHETKVILGIIYRDYLCDNEKREKLIKKENEILQQIEREKQEKYSIDNLFKNKNVLDSNSLNENIEMEVYKKQSLFSKLLNKFKKFFGKL